MRSLIDGHVIYSNGDVLHIKTVWSWERPNTLEEVRTGGLLIVSLRYPIHD